MANLEGLAQYIESLPMEVRKTIPAQTPPLGVVPNFLNPTSCATEVITVCSIFLVIAVTCYILRMYTKLKIAKRRSWDDLTVTAGFILSIVILGFFFNGLINGGSGKHQWDIHIDVALSRASMIQGYWTVVLSHPAMSLIKGSIFIQYYGLFYRLRWLRIAVWVGAALLILWYSAITILFFIASTPQHGESLIAAALSKRYSITPLMSIPSGVISLMFDIYLFVLPIPAVMKLQMTSMKKVGIVVVFTTGGLAVVASVVSLVYRVRLQMDNRDTTWKVAYVLLCNQVEMFAGVTVSSMPSVKHFTRSFSDKSTSTYSFSSLTRFLRKSTFSSSSSSSSSMQEKVNESNRSDISSQDSHYHSKNEGSTIRVTTDFSVSRESHEDC